MINVYVYTTDVMRNNNGFTRACAIRIPLSCRIEDLYQTILDDNKISVPFNKSDGVLFIYDTQSRRLNTSRRLERSMTLAQAQILDGCALVYTNKASRETLKF